MSREKRAVAVFSANSDVGFRVALGLASSQAYSVRAVINSNEGERAAQLTEAGAQVTELDPGSPAFSEGAVASVLQGCHACFLSTKTHFTEFNFEHKEIDHGVMIVEQCRLAGIQHLIYQTHVTVEFSIGILARQMDAKEYVERRIRQLEIPATGLILPVPFEVLLDYHKPVRKGPQQYAIEIPMGEIAFDGISLSNVADIVRGILDEGKKGFGCTYAVTTGKLTVEDWARELSSQLRPLYFRDAKVTVAQMRVRGSPEAEDTANMYEFLTRQDVRHNPGLTRRLAPAALDFPAWVRASRASLLHALGESSG